MGLNRRQAAPGIRRGIRASVAQRGDAISKAAGDSLVWRVQATDFLPGTPPEVAAAPNLVSANGDISNAVAADRPTSSGAGVPGASWEFPQIGTQYLRNEATDEPLLYDGDYCAWVTVALLENDSERTLIETSGAPTVAHTQGLTLKKQGPDFRVSARCKGIGALQGATIPFPANPQVTSLFAGRLTSTQLIADRGTDRGTKAILNTGIDGDQSAVSLGIRMFNDDAPFYGNFYIALLLRNPTDDQYDNTKAAAGVTYGVPT